MLRLMHALTLLAAAPAQADGGGLAAVARETKAQRKARERAEAAARNAAAAVQTEPPAQGELGMAKGKPVGEAPEVLADAAEEAPDTLAEIEVPEVPVLTGEVPEVLPQDNDEDADSEGVDDTVATPAAPPASATALATASPQNDIAAASATTFMPVGKHIYLLEIEEDVMSFGRVRKQRALVVLDSPEGGSGTLLRRGGDPAKGPASWGLPTPVPPGDRSFKAVQKAREDKIRQVKADVEARISGKGLQRLVVVAGAPVIAVVAEDPTTKKQGVALLEEAPVDWVQGIEAKLFTVANPNAGTKAGPTGARGTGFAKGTMDKSKF